MVLRGAQTQPDVLHRPIQYAYSGHTPADTLGPFDRLRRRQQMIARQSLFLCSPRKTISLFQAAPACRRIKKAAPPSHCQDGGAVPVCYAKGKHGTWPCIFKCAGRTAHMRVKLHARCFCRFFMVCRLRMQFYVAKRAAGFTGPPAAPGSAGAGPPGESAASRRRGSCGSRPGWRSDPRRPGA